MSVPTESPDAASPFAPATLRAGAVITASGAGSVPTAEQIVGAVESASNDVSVLSGDHDQWLLPGIVALSRGEAWIVPLSWEPASLDDSELRDRATELWSAVRGACEYRHGVQIGIDLSPDRETRAAYAEELVRTNARRADWWSFDDRAVVLVVYGPPLPGLKTALALQVVPRSWVWDDASRDVATSSALDTGDLSWSWADVVTFADDR